MPATRRHFTRALLAVALLGPALQRVARAAASQVEALVWRARALPDGGVVVDLSTRITLGPAVEDALQRGVPVTFVARATLYRERWYWRDRRSARVLRSWRLAYQPLIGRWRVTQGALSQTHATLPEALAGIGSAANWRIAEPGTLEADASFYVEVIVRLDESQLPGPMQIGLTAQGDWALSAEHSLRVE